MRRLDEKLSHLDLEVIDRQLTAPQGDRPRPGAPANFGTLPSPSDTRALVSRTSGHLLESRTGPRATRAALSVGSCAVHAIATKARSMPCPSGSTLT